MDAMVTAIERAREVAASGPLAQFLGEEIHPGPQVASRADLEEEVRRHVEHTYHPACTARIGTESDGVVDPELRVQASPSSLSNTLHLVIMKVYSSYGCG